MMKELKKTSSDLPVKVYKQVSLTGEKLRRAADTDLLLKFRYSSRTNQDPLLLSPR